MRCHRFARVVGLSATNARTESARRGCRRRRRPVQPRRLHRGPRRPGPFRWSRGSLPESDCRVLEPYDFDTSDLIGDEEDVVSPSDLGRVRETSQQGCQRQLERGLIDRVGPESSAVHRDVEEAVPKLDPLEQDVRVLDPMKFGRGALGARWIESIAGEKRRLDPGIAVVSEPEDRSTACIGRSDCDVLTAPRNTPSFGGVVRIRHVADRHAEAATDKHEVARDLDIDGLVRLPFAANAKRITLGTTSPLEVGRGRGTVDTLTTRQAR